MDANDVHAGRNAAQRILGHGVDPSRPRPRPGLLIPGKVVRGKEAIEGLSYQALDVNRLPPPSAGLHMLYVIHVTTDNGVAVLKGKPEELRQLVVRVGQHVAGAVLKICALADEALDAVLRTARVHDGELVDGRQVLEFLVHLVLGGLVDRRLESVVTKGGRLRTEKRLPVMRLAGLGPFTEKFVVSLYVWCRVGEYARGGTVT